MQHLPSGREFEALAFFALRADGESTGSPGTPQCGVFGACCRTLGLVSA